MSNLKFFKLRNLLHGVPPFGGSYAAFFLTLCLCVFMNTYFSLAKADPLDTETFNQIVSLTDAESGSLLFESQQSGQYILAPTINTDVHMEISGLVARVYVTQHFSNPSSEWVNGIYVFPLPESAAVDHMKMIIGERIIEGIIKERKEAKRIYTKAKQHGKKASLIEQERSNIFTNSVANIGPNEKISISIEYQQTLKYDQGEFSIRFPMVVGIRYIPGTQKIKGFSGTGWAANTNEVDDASRISPPVSEPEIGHSNPVSISVNLQAGFPLVNVESSYHPINKNVIDAAHYEIELANNKTSANRDFLLRWRPQISHDPQAALFTQDKNQHTYALFMLMPPEIDWSKEESLAKETIYVIDTSGSMSGASIQQAKQALIIGLKQLKSEDWFNIIQFNSYTEAFSSQALPSRENNIARAISYVESLQADGGTEMASALHAALANVSNTERIRQVIFLTDGSVGNEQALFKIINEKLNTSRLFTVGIGSAPNSYFMSEAASLGRGTFTYIGDIKEVKEKMSQLFHKLNHPVLSDLELIWENRNSVDYWPKPIQDLYIGEPLIVSLKLPKNQKQLTIQGRYKKSKWSTALPINSGGKAKGLDVLWARNKIQSLNQKISRGADREEIKQAITKLGLTHHIVTQYTSLIAVDVSPTRPIDRNSKDKAIPVKKPHSWNMRIPQSATPAQINIILGFVLLIIAFLIRNIYLKKCLNF